MKKLNQLFENNEKWVESITKEDPDFFANLSQGQSPEYLWIGCSDSRIPVGHIVDLPPGNVFVHRNIANVVVHTDLNCLSVMQYSIEVLKVKHVVVCGHYGCGGVKASMGDDSFGLIDNWLCHLKDVRRLNEDKLAGLSEEEKFDRLCELNVREQVINVCNTSIVQGVWKSGVELPVHGVIYDLKDGKLKDLEITISNNEELQAFMAS